VVQPECRGFDFRWSHLYFIILPAQYGPGVNSVSDRNEYQEHILGIRVASAYGLQTYHLHVPIFLKSGSLKILELSGPVQSYTGIALPFPRCVKQHVYKVLHCRQLNIKCKEAYEAPNNDLFLVPSPAVTTTGHAVD